MSRIVVKKKGEDDNLVTSVRLPRELVNRLDKFAAKTDLSRNQLIVSLLSQAGKSIFENAKIAE